MTPPKTLIDTFGDCRTIYFCGLAKNAGKTMALKSAMAEARAAGRSVAVTSVGRDGEAFDVIYSDFAKPRLLFEEGDVVISVEGMLLDAAACTIIHRFGLRSPMGPLAAARVDARCEIEVAGPPTVSGLREVRAWAEALGVDLLLVDGALDRKAASLPDVCDGLVLSTGAVLDADLNAVVEETVSALEMLSLEIDGRTAVSNRLSYSPIFDPSAKLDEAVHRASMQELIIDIEGSVNDRVVDHLARAGVLRRTCLIVDCHAKVFLSRRTWRRYREQGLRIAYRRPIKVLAVTVNPVAPAWPGFEPVAFLGTMRGALEGVTVFDVCGSDYGQREAQMASRRDRHAAIGTRP